MIRFYDVQDRVKISLNIVFLNKFLNELLLDSKILIFRSHILVPFLKKESLSF